MNLSFFRTIAAAISIAIAGQCCGQEEPGPASVELSFAGENKKTIVGLFGLTFNQSIECILTTSVNETEFGVQGWSISLAPDPGLDIVAITIEGTVAAGEDEGGRRRGGFERTELTQGEGNAGAVSAVVLAYVDLVTLPLTGTEVIARLDIQCPYPEVGVTETKVIRYVDGRQGSGEPVENVVAQADYDVEPELVPYEVVLLGIDENAVTYDCNSDGRVNIADAVCMLNWLFLGGPDPGCQDAMNFNGDARLNIADAISGLNFLFLGGPPPCCRGRLPVVSRLREPARLPVIVSPGGVGLSTERQDFAYRASCPLFHAAGRADRIIESLSTPAVRSGVCHSVADAVGFVIGVEQ